MPPTLHQRYQATVEFMFSQLPMYHRTGVQAYKKDVSNILALMDFLGHPYRDFPCIHVAGTNGKGSTAHMISAVLQSRGLKTGLFISPHYRDYRERIKLNGKLLDKAFVVDFIEAIRPALETIRPSFFEMTVAMAFSYFSRQKADVAVIEVGLGGRLDSTNVIHPLLSVITNISFDHMHLLGDTLPLIAGEKAGIIKEGVPVVIGETHPESAPVFLAKAEQMSAPIVFADQHYRAEVVEEDFHYTVFDVYRDGVLRFPALKTNLTGGYQQKNIQTALQAVELIAPRFQLEDQHIREGLGNLKSLTRLIGRWDLIRESPRVLADSAHNEAGIRMAVDQLAQVPFDRLHIVLGMVSDKDLSGILSLLPTKARYYFAKADIPRGLDAQELKRQAAAFGLTGRAYSSVKQAFRAAIRQAAKEDLIFVGGSIFVVAEVI
ncbi:MAG: bifunctional folylpolyglutamate synthase/dihydrofolate synthase [Haliscomenobacter sp.]|nr:bifunctional folylpolyglutamate synthase/dihydrofolate synthase [Haliscomenobacter sp.]MBP9873867.1 bifunctional folylpolyglutamate synthase/dihydrofolate synthase [Haliscomenobacter sp.]